MIPRRRLAAALVTSLILATGAAPAYPCGFDGVFDGNFGVSHPLAMAVAVATRQAVLDEVLPASATGPLVGGSAGLWPTTARIHALARSLSLTGPGDQQGFALHLADSGLWARLTPSPAGLVVEIHIDGPRPGEAVLVTHGAVLERLVDGRMTARAALDHGLLVLDASRGAVDAIGLQLARFDEKAAAPGAATADLRQRLPWRGAAGRPTTP
ncbi:hypothetical protein [Phreatobacter stygius]|uniref:Uncharacterized protein n=1 Tax=Phreatobacter stygius TaxID=1940610 RepID=A0A4D7B4M6_9HYPH|nr:hypothetical protein [Phreatobacter stygius]QCI67891.1 hypothetical protein E8M01_28870 [Phreatobacter stygius]